MSFIKESALERLKAARTEGRLAHAYLVTGPDGAGKDWLAMRMAEVILETGNPSGHPDFHSVSPESKSRRILIAQMRELDQSLQMKPLVGHTKFAVVHDADRLQQSAANAFLKTLEEPPPGCHLFLLTALPEAVMETIISRCIAVPLRVPSDARADVLAGSVAKALAGVLLMPGGPDIAAAVRFTRIFQKATAAVRERVTGELEAELKRQVKHYGESANADWEETRESQIKAQAEAAVIAEREILLHQAAGVFAAALRHHHAPSEPVAPEIAKIARANPPAILFRRIAALDRVRDLLARNVQEGLALESGFLGMIVPHT
jgi:DNA polymerase-3 subunit delta'